MVAERGRDDSGSPASSRQPKLGELGEGAAAELLVASDLSGGERSSGAGRRRPRRRAGEREEEG